MAATMFAHHVFVADGGKVSISRAQKTNGRPARTPVERWGYGGQAHGSFPFADEAEGVRLAEIREFQLGSAMAVPSQLDIAAIVGESRLFTPADIEFAARRTAQLAFERVLFERGEDDPCLLGLSRPDCW